MERPTIGTTQVTRKNTTFALYVNGDGNGNGEIDNYGLTMIQKWS